MLINQGVDIQRLNKEIWRGLGIVGKIFRDNNEELVVKRTFKGYGGALSLRTGDDGFEMGYPIKLPDTVIRILRRALGPDYDVVEKADHVHIEYNPEGSYKKR